MPCSVPWFSLDSNFGSAFDFDFRLAWIWALDWPRSELQISLDLSFRLVLILLSDLLGFGFGLALILTSAQLLTFALDRFDSDFIFALGAHNPIPALRGSIFSRGPC